ncbi:hypothetical protein BV20DRAFT_939840, partial [Pilatotrama ljubarskyi]
APWCHAGCTAIETAHHIFVACPSFADLHQSALRDLIRDTAEIWPQHSSRYYLGTMPPLHPDPELADSCDARHLITRVVHGWHLASIRLAGRIWGTYKRRISPRSPPPSPTASLVLPAYLAHLLQ